MLPSGSDDVCDQVDPQLPLRQHTPPVDTVVAWRPQDDAPVFRRFLRVALSTPEPDVLGPDHARA